MTVGGLAALAAQLRAGDRSPLEVVEEALARIEAANDALGAFVHVDPAAARAEALRLASEARGGATPGPLHGVPFAVKDLIDVRGWPTRAQSRVRTGRVVRRDAAVVAALRRAGAIPVGKLALQEFGLGADEDATPWPPARNPWRPCRTAGGSSSGAGAAVAAGLVPLAIGTDTGGSVRFPAALCGVVGFKPSLGAISVAGVLPLAPSLDHVGWLTRSADDARLVWEALRDGLARPHGGPAAEPAPAGVRVGVLRHFYEQDVIADADTRAAIARAVAALEALGCGMTELRTAPADAFRACGATLLAYEAHALHRRWLAADPSAYGAATRAVLERGAQISRAQYEAAVERRVALRRALDRQLRDHAVDLLVTAVSPRPAWRIGDAQAGALAGDGAMRMAFNVLGLPVLAMPVGTSADGLPLSMQLAAAPGRTRTLLRVAGALQHVTSWHRRRPPAPAGRSR